MKTFPFLTLCTLAFASASLAAEDYEIRLHRPARAGQKFAVTVTAKDVSDSVLETDGTKLKEQHKVLEVDYAGEATVLEVGENGRVTKESHKVNSLLGISGGDKKPVLDQGTVVIAFRRNKKPAFEISGAAVSKEISDALALVIDVNDGTGPNEDEILGTNDRKKIGDHWPVHKDLLEKILSKDEAMRVENASGEFTLKEVVKDAGGEAIVVEGAVKGKAVFPTPPGFNTQESTLAVSLSARFPTNPALPRTQERNELDLKITASGKPNPDGPEVQLKVTAKRTVVRKQTLLK